MFVFYIILDKRFPIYQFLNVPEVQILSFTALYRKIPFKSGLNMKKAVLVIGVGEVLDGRCVYAAHRMVIMY